MSSVVIWRPEALNARLVAAARPAAAEFAHLAAARAPSKRVAASIRVLGTTTDFTVGSTDPLASIFEGGAKPHEIDAKKGALKLASGEFASFVQHPGMAARPFLHPILPLWGSLYRRQAAGAFRGF